MREHAQVDYEMLAHYQEQLLPAEKRAWIQDRIDRDPEWRDAYERLHEANHLLEEWGRCHRVYQKVAGNLHAQPAAESKSAIAWDAWLRPVMVAALFLVVGLALWLSLNHAPGMQVLEQRGQVAIEAIESANSGLAQITTEAQGFLALRLPDGVSSACFGQETRATITGPREIQLDAGISYHMVAQADRQSYRVITPHGNVRVLGTQFEVEVNEQETIVRVKEGHVEVRAAQSNRANLPVELKALDQAVISNRSIEQKTLPAGRRIGAWVNPSMELTPGDISPHTH